MAGKAASRVSTLQQSIRVVQAGMSKFHRPQRLAHQHSDPLILYYVRIQFIVSGTNYAQQIVYRSPYRGNW